MNTNVSEEYAIYLRKSRGDSELEALGIDVLERHEHALLDLAKRMNITIGHIYREVVSGDSISTRPQMQALLHDVEDFRWKGVLVVEVERLARGDTIDQGIVQRTFQYSDTLIVTPLKIYNPASESDQEYFEFGLFMSRREYNTIKRRLRNGKYAAAAEGKWPFNSAPYGFSRVRLAKGFTLELDATEAPVARLIFSLFTGVERIGISMIRNYLNTHNIRTRSGKLWTDGMIRDLLSNPVYDQKVAIGRRKTVTKLVNGQPIKTRPRSDDYKCFDGIHPRMVDHGIFAEAQTYLGLGAPKPPESYGVKNPLAGLVVCGECGHKMLRRPATSPKTKNGAKYDSMLCKTPGCPTVGCALSVLEKELLHSLSEWVKGYELQAILPESHAKEKEELVTAASSDLSTLEAQRERLYDLLEQGVYTNEVFLERSHNLQSRINDARDRLSSLEKELAQARQIDAHILNFIPSCKDLLSCYWDLSATDRNQALRMLLESVEYRKYEKNKKGCKEEASFDLIIKPRIPHG